MNVPHPVFPLVLSVIVVFLILSETLVLIGVALILFPESSKGLGPLPVGGAALPQRVGAGHRQATHIVDHGRDVVAVTNHAPTHYGLKEWRHLSLRGTWHHHIIEGFVP